MAVRVQQDDFDVGAESRALQGPAVGAIALFVGTVRSLSEDDSVTAMTLEHYPGMTEAEISRIEDDARARWPLLDVTVVHRVGRLLAGEQIVLVAVSSAHRQAAFDAAQYMMDFLKTDAPFWKAEERGDEVSWVEARQSDNDAHAKWTQE
jgi:molybdopterin synthase catalytic subunit